MQPPEVANAWAEVTYNETEVVALNGSYDGSDGNGTTMASVLARTVSASVKSQTVITSCLMFTAGVVGNVLALVVLATSGAEQRKTLFYKLVAGLAVTDLLGTLATSPVVIAVYLNDFRWLGGAVLCHYFSFSMLVACLASMLIVCAMSVERYICVRHPYTYYTKLSRTKFSTLTLLSCWLAALVIAALPLAGVGSNVQQFPNTWCFFDFRSRRAPDLAFNFIFVVTALACIVVTFVCNVSVIYTLVTLRSRQSGLSAEPKASVGSASSFRTASSFRSASSSTFSSKRSSSSTSSSSMLQLRRRKRATTRRFGEVQMMLMLMGVTIIFTACFAPLTIFVLICQTPTSLDSRRLVLPLIRIASFNPILDPWVYILFRRELSWRVVRLVRWVLRLPPLLPPGHSAQEQQQQQQQQNLLSWDRKSELSAPTRNGSIASSGVAGSGAGKTLAKSKRFGSVLWGSRSGKFFSRHAARKGSGLDNNYAVVSDGSCSSTSSSASSSSGLVTAAGSKRKGDSFHGPELDPCAESGEGNLRTSLYGEPEGSDFAAQGKGLCVTTYEREERDEERSVLRRGSDMAGGGLFSSKPSMFRYNSMKDGSVESEDRHPQKQQRRRAVSIVSFSLDISEPPLPSTSHPRRSSALDKVRELPEEGFVPRPRRSLSFSAISESPSDDAGAARVARQPSIVEGEMSWSDPYNPSCLAFWYQCLCLPPAPRTSGSLAYGSSVREMSCRRLSTVTQRAMSIASSSDVQGLAAPGMR